MKTFRKSSLISSVALLLVAIVALSGATFAWFSSKSEATATGINATTTQGSNLVISDAIDTNWTQSLTLTVADELAPATTNDLATWKSADAAEFDDQKAATWKDGGDYIQQTIYAKYDATSGTHDLKLTVTPTGDLGDKSYYRVAVQPITAQNLSNTTTEATYFFATDADYADDTVVTYSAQQFGQINLGTIDAGAVYGYNVFVWFEGEDLDCKDTNAKNDIDLTLAFA